MNVAGSWSRAELNGRRTGHMLAPVEVWSPSDRVGAAVQLPGLCRAPSGPACLQDKFQNQTSFLCEFTPC